MKRLYFIANICLFVALFQIKAQIPTGYYSTINSQTGATLKTALYNVIKNPSVTSYGGLYTSFLTTDKKPNGKVWDMYSDIPSGTPAYEYSFGTTCGNYNSEGDCFNREHSFPQSWFNSNSPMQSDLFHLYPTDGSVNGTRSNWPFGEVGNASKITSNGSKLGTSSFTGYSGTVFEPIDEYKGDFARTYFYMATCYETQIAGWVSNGNAGSVLAGNSFPVYDQWYINLIAKWHRQDPVSAKEISRNNAAYNVQGNRNPYIDHPEYAGLVWNFSTTTGTSTTTSPPVTTPSAINNPPITQTVSVNGTNTSTISGNLNGYFSDVDPDILTLTDVDNEVTIGGNISINSYGNITFLPLSTFVGTLNYSYSVCDPFTCTSGIIYISVSQGTVAGINHAPTATNFTIAGLKNLAISGSVTGFGDIDNEQLTIRLLTTGTGLMSLNQNGKYSYIPQPNFIGIDTKYYSVCDPHQACVTAQMVFSITGIVTTTTPSAINEFHTDEAHIYPNPSSGVVYIYTKTPETLTICNLIGEKIISVALSEGSKAVDLHHLPKGIYFFKFGSYTGKLLLSH